MDAMIANFVTIVKDKFGGPYGPTSEMVPTSNKFGYALGPSGA